MDVHLTAEAHGQKKLRIRPEAVGKLAVVRRGNGGRGDSETAAILRMVTQKVAECCPTA